MDIDLTRKTWAAFGYKESGKSTLAKIIGTEWGTEALYYDTLKEVPDTAKFHAYKPKNAQSVMELESVLLLLKQNHRYRMLIIDEANRYCPPKPHPLPLGVQDANDWCRHPQYNMSIGYIARRPVQINSDLVEICDYLFVFQLGGKNDIQYLNGLHEGLGDTVRNLKPYWFCFVNKNRTWEICEPLKVPADILNSDTKTLKGNTY
jgi:hypothetical protein